MASILFWRVKIRKIWVIFSTKKATLFIQIFYFMYFFRAHNLKVSSIKFAHKCLFFFTTKHKCFRVFRPKFLPKNWIRFYFHFKIFPTFFCQKILHFRKFRENSKDSSGVDKSSPPTVQSAALTNWQLIKWLSVEQTRKSSNDSKRANALCASARPSHCQSVSAFHITPFKWS